MQTRDIISSSSFSSSSKQEKSTPPPLSSSSPIGHAIRDDRRSRDKSFPSLLLHRLYYQIRQLPYPTITWVSIRPRSPYRDYWLFKVCFRPPDRSLGKKEKQKDIYIYVYIYIYIFFKGISWCKCVSTNIFLRGRGRERRGSKKLVVVVGGECIIGRHINTHLQIFTGLGSQ